VRLAGPSCISTRRLNILAGKNSVSPELRDCKRVGIALPCRFLVSGSIQNGKLLDLSMGGAFIGASSIPSADESITLLLRFPGSSSETEIAARVTHSGWYLADFENLEGFGVRFVEPSPEAVSALHRTLCNAAANPSPRKWVLER
jgi:hypothetical protein